jgi:Ca-activated chloride channel family protein
MNCLEVQERLTEHALDEAQREAIAIERHVSGCPACAGELAALRRTAGLLRAMEWPEAPTSLTPERRERLESRAPTPVRPRRSWSRVGLMAAASLVAVSAAVAFLTPSLLRSRVAATRSASRAARASIRAADPAVVTEIPRLGKRDGREGQAQGTKDALTKAQRQNLQALGYITGDVPKKGTGDKKLHAKAVVDVVGSAPVVDRSYSMSSSEVAETGNSSISVTEGPKRPGDPGSRVKALYIGRPDLASPGSARDMFFEHKGTNPFVFTREDSLSTFGLDVDTASYSVARNYLMRGELPPAEAVRVEEFVNALPQDYAPPTREAFAIHLEGAPNPFHRGYHLLRIGLKAREVRMRDRKPAVLTFVIDVSGSMGTENRLGLVKRSLRLLVDRLGERDRIGIVVYGTRGRILLDPTPASERREILGAIESLRPEGSTNLEEGLDLGYEMALQTLDPEATNRVVLCTDGVANNGITDAETLLRRIHAQSEKHVFLTALGFGMGNYNDALLQKLADQGDGQYAYIDDFAEAERFFLTNLTGVLEVVARDAKAQVEFDPGSVESYRLLGYEKRDVADEDFRDDAVDGGEVGAGHAVTVLYELKLTGRGGDLGVVHLRYQDPDSGSPREQREDIEGDLFRSRFYDASPSFRLSVVAARFAEHLRESRWVRGERLESVLEEAERLPRSFLVRAEAAELLDLMRRAIDYSSPRR